MHGVQEWEGWSEKRLLLVEEWAALDDEVYQTAEPIVFGMKLLDDTFHLLAVRKLYGCARGVGEEFACEVFGDGLLLCKKELFVLIDV